MADRNGIEVVAGLDYHANSIQVCVMDLAGRVLANRICGNDAVEVATICSEHGRVRGVALEACSGAADFAQSFTEVTGWSTDLAHPGFVSRMKQSPDKSDHSDANVLADLTRVGYLPRVWLAPTYIRELRVLDTMRDGIAEEIRRCRQRIRAIMREQRVRPPSGLGCAWTRRWTAWLIEQAPLSDSGRFLVEFELRRLRQLLEDRAQIEARMRKHTEGDQVVTALQAEPGVGEVIAWKLRARIGRFDRFRSGKQLARFCGLTPCNSSSGQRMADSGLIYRCDRTLRAMLLQAGHSLRLHHPRWRSMAVGMARRGKPGSVIAAAIANRWLRGLYHRMKELGMGGM